MTIMSNAVMWNVVILNIVRKNVIQLNVDRKDVMAPEKSVFVFGTNTRAIL
jgi:hypothetical protein